MNRFFCVTENRAFQNCCCWAENCTRHCRLLMNQEGGFAGVASAQDWAGLPCRSFSVARGLERRDRISCRNALTARQPADMSLTLRVKHFQLSVRCKGEKITKVDFRGKCYFVIIRAGRSRVRRVSPIGWWFYNDASSAEWTMQNWMIAWMFWWSKIDVAGKAVLSFLLKLNFLFAGSTWVWHLTWQRVSGQK
jgi:hypothetical protein